MREAKAREAKALSGEGETVIVRLGAQGDGVALIAGQSVHVPLTAPGDHVRLAYGGAHGRVLELLAPGPDRVPPPCPYFGRCGGCALQHIADEAYRRFKIEALRETLAQRGLHDPPLAPLTLIPEGARRRATFAFRIAAEGAALGFFRAGTRDVLDLARCLLLSPAIARALPGLRALLAAHGPQGASGRLHVTDSASGLDVDLALDRGTLSGAQSAGLIAAGAGLGLARLTLAGEELARWRTPVIGLGGIDVALPPRAFLQPSAEGEQTLQAWVRDGVGPARRVADLFAGLGTFTLALAPTAQLHAVDFDADLLAALDGARKAPGLKPISLERRDLIRNPLPAATLSKFDAVLFDPPRAGARAQTEAIAASGVARVIAVSCNAATFARDARHLVAAGYRLDWLRPLDQFRWSAHIELVALFTRDGPP